MTVRGSLNSSESEIAAKKWAWNINAQMHLKEIFHTHVSNGFKFRHDRCDVPRGKQWLLAKQVEALLLKGYA